MTDLTSYNAYREGVAVFQLPDPGFLRIGGDDRVDYLQRQTTNDLRELTLSRALVSVLTSSTARILDVFTLLDKGEHIDVLSLPGRAETAAGFLRSRIFFNDDINLENLSSEFDQLFMVGPNSSAMLHSLGLNVPQTGEITQGVVEDVQVTIVGKSDFRGESCLLVLPSTQVTRFLSSLTDAGATQLDAKAYDLIRIEMGIPGPEGELNKDYTPLEVGLQEIAVSLSKGCYTGQEVIARQVNYDKITRKLVGLRLDARVEVGSQVRADGKPAGQVTSVASSPSFGEIALAILKRPFDQAGKQVTVGDIRSEVENLPFT